MNILEILVINLTFILSIEIYNDDESKDDNRNLVSIKSENNTNDSHSNETNPKVSISGYYKSGKGFRESFVQSSLSYSGNNGEELEKIKNDIKNAYYNINKYYEDTNKNEGDNKQIVKREPFQSKIGEFKVSSREGIQNEQGDEFFFRKFDITNLDS
ncbi:hypothetical protein DMUE_4290 [Dictyocoela muelleri]|nr:hypothetical protein DMUE_4290 [Dictyocoela muelleri]